MSLIPNRHEFFSLKTAEVGKTVVWLFYWKKKILKEKRPKKQNSSQSWKWQPRTVPATFPTNPNQTTVVYHGQTNLLTVFGPRGFDWQLVRLTSAAVRQKIFQNKLNNGKKSKIFLLFVRSCFLGKANSKTFSTTKVEVKKVDHI